MRYRVARTLRTSVTCVLTATAFGVTAAVTVALLAPATPAQASVVNGPLTRQEITDRAQYWVDAGITYTQTGTWFRDREGDKTYRRDCSGR